VTFQRAREALVLVDLESGRYHTLEGCGDRVWDLSDGDHPVAAIVTELTAAYGVDAATVKRDVLELLQDMSAEGLIDDAR
jgi:hypothetical protein